MARISVLMCTDGTYPYYHGGVSVWCDQVVQNIDADFKIFAITHAPNRTPVLRFRRMLGTSALYLFGERRSRVG
jgi:hypothetical protein